MGMALGSNVKFVPGFIQFYFVKQKSTILFFLIKNSVYALNILFNSKF